MEPYSTFEIQVKAVHGSEQRHAPDPKSLAAFGPGDAQHWAASHLIEGCAGGIFYDDQSNLPEPETRIYVVLFVEVLRRLFAHRYVVPQLFQFIPEIHGEHRVGHSGNQVPSIDASP